MTEPQFAVHLPESVTLADGPGGLPVIRAETPLATSEVFLHGGHVSAWTPFGHDPVIWMSAASEFARGTAIRGGVPICFPWFGGGREPGMSPAHGFARLAGWSLVGVTDEGGVVTITLRLTEADVAGLPAAGVWPHPFEATYSVTLGTSLDLALTVRNTGADAYSFEEALHTYLQVSDIATVTVEGLDAARFLDKTPGAGPDPVVQAGPVTFSGETDRVYHATGEVTVLDPGAARAITLSKGGSATTVVWNPWTAKAVAMADFGDDEWVGMVCVETANAGPDAVTLGPGESHTMTARSAVSSR